MELVSAYRHDQHDDEDKLTRTKQKIHKMARAISDEARALNNEGVSGLEFWAPNIK